MESFDDFICPSLLDTRIEQLYRELMDDRLSLIALRTAKNLSKKKIADLERRVDTHQHLIAEYSQLGVRLAIEEDEPPIENSLEDEPTLLEPKQVAWFRSRLRDWAKENLRDFPWRQTQQPYAVLIAEMMLQQTRAERVAKTYKLFIEKFPNLTSLANASVEEIATAIAPLGLKFRAARLKQLAQLLLEPVYSQQIPDSETALLKLPGVGRYTAKAVLAGAFNRPTAVLDTNVARILERYFGVVGGRIKSRDEMLWRLAHQVSPKKEVKTWNWTLIDFGAAVCTAQKPLCPSCPLKRRCEYYARKGTENRE